VEEEDEEEEEKMIMFVDLLAIVAFCLPDSKKLGDIVARAMQLCTFELQRKVSKCKVLIHQSLLLQIWGNCIPCSHLALQ
jgi:hypothetical protein